jgi:hypothetical protein
VIATACTACGAPTADGQSPAAAWIAGRIPPALPDDPSVRPPAGSALCAVPPEDPPASPSEGYAGSSQHAAAGERGPRRSDMVRPILGFSSSSSRARFVSGRLCRARVCDPSCRPETSAKGRPSTSS